MSSFTHEQNQHNGFYNTDDERSSSSEGSDCRDEKELLTKSWVEQQQRTRSDESIINDIKDSKGVRNGCVNTNLNARYNDNNGNRDLNSDGSIVRSIHRNKLEDNASVSNEKLLTERHFKHTEPNMLHTNHEVASEISGILLRRKLEDINLHKEALKLPLLSKSPLISPCPSPCASPPRSSVHGGSDSSAASSPGDSPALSPKVKFASSLPRNLINLKDRYNDDSVQVSRSLPGSPRIRRSLLGRPSDSNDHMLRPQASLEKETNGRDLSLSNRIIDSLNGSHQKRAPSSLSINSKLSPRRPGTPIARDIRPGLHVCQLSRSMSDLGAIREKSTEENTRQDHHGLFPSIIAK